MSPNRYQPVPQQPKSAAQISPVNKNNYHFFEPLLPFGGPGEAKTSNVVSPTWRMGFLVEKRSAKQFPGRSSFWHTPKLLAFQPYLARTENLLFPHQSPFQNSIEFLNHLILFLRARFQKGIWPWFPSGGQQELMDNCSTPLRHRFLLSPAQLYPQQPEGKVGCRCGALKNDKKPHTITCLEFWFANNPFVGFSQLTHLGFKMHWRQQRAYLLNWHGRLHKAPSSKPTREWKSTM